MLSKRSFDFEDLRRKVDQAIQTEQTMVEVDRSDIDWLTEDIGRLVTRSIGVEAGIGIDSHDEIYEGYATDVDKLTILALSGLKVFRQTEAAGKTRDELNSFFKDIRAFRSETFTDGIFGHVAEAAENAKLLSSRIQEFDALQETSNLQFDFGIEFAPSTSIRLSFELAEEIFDVKDDYDWLLFANKVAGEDDPELTLEHEDRELVGVGDRVLSMSEELITIARDLIDSPNDQIRQWAEYATSGVRHTGVYGRFWHGVLSDIEIISQ